MSKFQPEQPIMDDDPPELIAIQKSDQRGERTILTETNDLDKANVDGGWISSFEVVNVEDMR